MSNIITIKRPHKGITTMSLEKYGHSSWYSIAVILFCTPIHAYRIIVSNGTDQKIASAVYRSHQGQSYLIRTSVAKDIEVGQTMWFGGVLPSNETTQFLLYGASSKEALIEALATRTSLKEPYKLFDVGTGTQFFIINEQSLQQPVDTVVAPDEAAQAPVDAPSNPAAQEEAAVAAPGDLAPEISVLEHDITEYTQEHTTPSEESNTPDRLNEGVLAQLSEEVIETHHHELDELAAQEATNFDITPHEAETLHDANLDLASLNHDQHDAVTPHEIVESPAAAHAEDMHVSDMSEVAAIVEQAESLEAIHSEIVAAPEYDQCELLEIVPALFDIDDMVLVSYDEQATLEHATLEQTSPEPAVFEQAALEPMSLEQVSLESALLEEIPLEQLLLENEFQTIPADMISAEEQPLPLETIIQQEEALTTAEEVPSNVEALSPAPIKPMKPGRYKHRPHKIHKTVSAYHRR